MPLQLTETPTWENVLEGPDGMDEALALDVRTVLIKLMNRTLYLKGQIETLALAISPEALAAAQQALLIAQQADALLPDVLAAKDAAFGAAQDAQALITAVTELQGDMQDLLDQVQAFLDGQQTDVTIARRNAANTFTQANTFNAAVTFADDVTVSGALTIPVRT